MNRANEPIQLKIERGRIATLDELPPRSIALDGFVQGPLIDTANDRYSFDHHAGCVRHATRATAEQVRDALVLGFDPRGYRVFVNDVDLDTALSVWLLANPHRVRDAIVNELVSSAGLLDAHSGAYPISESMRAIVEWISEPETFARADGTYWSLDDAALEELISDVSRRIDIYTRGEARPSITRFEVDERYEIVRPGKGWVLARTIGVRSHASLFRDGYHRVVMFRQLPDGSWGYTVAKQSDFVKSFPIEVILAALAKQEPGWGGGSTIGGAPRHHDGSRSRLPPDEVFAIVEGVVSSLP
jgi:hypothetical protein